MYDFYFGTKDQIEKDPRTWLLTIKRMLPRWPNGIPDSEYLALFDILQESEKDHFLNLARNSILVETGSGASTIVLLYFALKWDTELYTWDISGNKLAYIRGVLNDTLFRIFRGKNLFNHWKYIAYETKSKYVGIPILKELGKKVCACFLDSEHTWENLKSELAQLSPILINGAIVAIDDGNYRYKHTNTAYVNMMRSKLGIKPIDDIESNLCRPFWIEVENFLNKKFKNIENLNGGSYRKNYKKDLFWAYYKADRKSMADLGMEKTEDLDHRFDAWRVRR